MTREALWVLDGNVTFLNHGSFGACPRPVLARQAALREAMESNPVRFMNRELEPLLDGARARVAAFVGARPADVVPVANATTAVSSVLRSFALRPGDEVLLTSHGYNACRVAAEQVAGARGARVVVVPVGLPVESAEAVVDRVLAGVSGRTRLAIIDAVTSPSGLLFPYRELVAELERRDVRVLVDGAHAPGMIPLELDRLGATAFTGNLHKWVCAPKGAAFLWVREDAQAWVRPAVLSHGASAPRPGRTAYHLEFDWTGTVDPTAFLSVPTALDVLEGLVPGGWPGLMAANRADALAARALLHHALGVEPIAPDGMVGAMATVELGRDGTGLSDRLAVEAHIEVPIIPLEGRWLVRVSLQRHVRPGDVERLARALSG